MISDPVRAVQSLPGVAANDDVQAEFAVRGADYRRVGLFIDGILTDNFLLVASGNSGEHVTFSVINSDTINEVSLFTGAFPAKYGDATAGVLSFGTRDGNRLKPAFRFSTGLQVGTSGVADGPLAKAGLLALCARSSLLDYMSRLVEKPATAVPTPGTLISTTSKARCFLILSLATSNSVSRLVQLPLKLDDRLPPGTINPNAVFNARSRNLLINAFGIATIEFPAFRSNKSLRYADQF